MTYYAIAQAAQDPSLRQRIQGCIAQEDQSGEHPQIVADRIAWKCAAEPGWGEAWDSAITAQLAKPVEDRTDVGADPAVIPDAWILTAVQKHLGAT